MEFYKKIIKSQDVRLNLLKILDFIPDKLMIYIQYKIKTGRSLNLKNPQRFTEKLQWYKLYYRDPLMTKCADKLEVREYVVSKGLSEILIPTYASYEKAEHINFSDLPNSFVIKTTNGSRTNIICSNKEKLNEHSTKEKLNEWLTKRTSKAGREWPYYNTKPKIMVEKLLEKDENDDLVDYKFVCFDGKVQYIFINAERQKNDELVFGIYDPEFNLLEFKRKGLRAADEKIKKPRNFRKMIKIAEKLSAEFPHVRVDLYNVDGKIYFGELTFFHGSGYVEFDPDDFDLILGKHFTLPSPV